MPQTATIVAATLPIGKNVLAVVTPDVADTVATLTLDRTVALGLNATAGPNIWSFKGGLDYSTDSGVTWTQLDPSFTCAGIVPSPPSATGLRNHIPAGQPMLRAWFTVPSGVTTLVIAGTLATS